MGASRRIDRDRESEPPASVDDAIREELDDLRKRIEQLERLLADEARKPLSNPLRRLSGTEQQIAQLVARGRSNHEVASELFVSPKTVEWNLSKIYKKLYVRSRTELAAKLGRLGAPAFG